MKQTILLIVIFCLGVLMGKNIIGLVIPKISLQILLSGLMLIIGLDIGRDQSQWQKLRQQSLHVFVFPVVTVIGSLLGASVAGFLLPQISLKDSLLVSSGFGYYSLSSALISSQYSAIIGTIALLSNILRETMTLVSAPVLVKIFGKSAIISSAGATAMDVCLSSVQKYAGKEFVYPSFISGFILTITVPFLINILLKI